MTKTRRDAWEAALSDEVQRQLYRLTRKPTDEEAREGRPWLRDFERDVLPYLSLQGIVAPSQATWYRFLGRMREADAAQTVIGLETSKRIAQGMVAANIDPSLASAMMTTLAVDEAAKPSDERNEKVMQIFASAAAMFASSAQRSEELKLKAARQKTADEQLRLAREKFEAAEKRLNAVQGAVDAPQLTDAERVAKIKSIFGMK